MTEPHIPQPRDTWREDMAWAGGLFEGEGCFTITHPHGSPNPRAAIKMTDRDSLERFHRIVGIGSFGGPYQPLGNRKPIFAWTAGGFQQTQAVVAMLWPWLGQRRRGRAIQVLAGSRSLKEAWVIRRERDRHEVECDVCGQVFVAVMSRTRSCSNYCRHKKWKTKQRAAH